MDQAFAAGNQGVICENVPLPLGKKLVLGLQHAFTMFGATVLVPLLPGSMFQLHCSWPASEL